MRKYILSIILFTIALFTSAPLFAEGSKDFYESAKSSNGHVQGNRTRLASMIGDGWAFNPYNTLGRHYVYAEAGERIHMGSSSQGYGRGTIILYSPTGQRYTSGTGGSNTAGRITNLAQELAGPRVNGTTPYATNGYTPFSSPVVTAETEGIWVVEFYAHQTGNEMPSNGSNNLTPGTHPLSQDWAGGESSRRNSDNMYSITAWDITVQKTDNTFASGRVYTNVLNLITNADTPTVHANNGINGFYGKLYTLTRDGFTYEIDNNGQNGLSFNIFVNNNGTIDTSKDPDDLSTPDNPGYRTYESFHYSGIGGILGKFHDPREVDDEYNVTHKIFYNLPDHSMPNDANIWVPTGTKQYASDWYMGASNGSTESIWLKRNKEGEIIPDDLKLVGVEGNEGLYTEKGANFEFTSELEGTYRIEIPSTSGQPRVLTGVLVLGLNKVYWDGKDGSGNDISGSPLSDVAIQLAGAEIHFPFLDVENNYYGVEIRAMNVDAAGNYTYVPTGDPDFGDYVFWNANALGNQGSGNPPTKRTLNGLPSTGTRSTQSSNNQRLWWGAIDNQRRNTGNNFGDNRAIVIWTNRDGVEDNIYFPLNTKKYDLEVSAISSSIISTSSPLTNSIMVGDKLLYTADIKNNGPEDAVIDAINDNSATFLFYVPKGIEIDPNDIEFNSSDGSLLVDGTMTIFEVLDKEGHPFNVISVKVEMPNGSTGTFTLPAEVVNGEDISLAPGDKINSWATILRAPDIVDVNAFNSDDNIGYPNDPFEEANGLHKNVGQLNLAANLDNLVSTDFANLAITNSSNPNFTNNIKYINSPLLDFKPSAKDDDREASPGEVVVFDILDNDKLVNGDTPTHSDVTVTLIVPTGAPSGTAVSNGGKTLNVPGEGVWTYDNTNGKLTFTPESSFKGTPTPIEYKFRDSGNRESNSATVTLTVCATGIDQVPLKGEILSNADWDYDRELSPDGTNLIDPNGPFNQIITVNAGEVYYTPGTGVEVKISNFYVNSFGTLVVRSGDVLKADGSGTIDGTMIVEGGAGVKVNAAVLMGTKSHGSTTDAIIKMKEGSYMSITGNLTVDIPGSFESYVLAEGSTIIEVCSPFSQNQNVEFIRYIGSDNQVAYFVTRDETSGKGVKGTNDGINSKVGNSPNIHWIEMWETSLDNSKVYPGAVSHCGPEADYDMCPAMWPIGANDTDPLDSSKSIWESCGMGEKVIDQQPEACVTGDDFVDLNDALQGAVPTGVEVVWFMTPDRSDTPVADPTNITQSTADGEYYYAFYYDDVNVCWNTDMSTSRVRVIIHPQCCAAGTDQVEVVDVITNADLPVVGESLFFDDFGVSLEPTAENDYGRTTTPYMPEGSFIFGTGNPNAMGHMDHDPDAMKAYIQNNHYAVVAPGYIKAGSPQDEWGNIAYYFWTPAYNEPNTVTDFSGTEDGAALVINAGSTLAPFYQRKAVLQEGATYKASFQLYIVNAGVRVAIDILDSNKDVIASVESDEFWQASQNGVWTLIELEFTIPGTDYCSAKEWTISFRNAQGNDHGNDYYVDNIGVEKIAESGGTCVNTPPANDCVTSGVASVDLNSAHIGTIPDGAELVWYTTANRQSGTEVTDPTEITESSTDSGDYYYAFFYDPIGDCWNTDLSTSKVEVIIYPPCTNYWHGGTIGEENSWYEKDNWTGQEIPDDGEDIEFATEVNNNGDAASHHLYLDKDRVIGNLINKSETEMNLVVTPGNQLIIEGKVFDDNTGIIVVEADKDEASGTLIFDKPEDNENVEAQVEFINLAQECKGCGFYKRQWQYFGIPVQGGTFPFNDPLLDGEMVRRWNEPTDGDKWLEIDDSHTMEPFRGYEITSNSGDTNGDKYTFDGKLNVGNKELPLTKTANVNYSGINLLANSYTAAIPITIEAITGIDPALVTDSKLTKKTVYLFNRGTRDQWRKTDGTNVYGKASGQYTAVPIEAAGLGGLPDRILSMHSFMVEAASDGAEITLMYDKLKKNKTDTDQPAWRSADNNGKRELPYIVLDVIGEGSADRLWLFEEATATRGYNNGWDGHKIVEEGLIQVFATDSDQNKLQVSTVPQFDDIDIAVAARDNESYTISVTAHADVDARRLYLHDTFTGRGYLLRDGAELMIPSTRNMNQNRFKITTSNLPAAMTEASPINTYVRNNSIVVENRSGENATVSVYDISGRFVGKAQIAKDEMKSFPELSMTKGVMVVKVISDSSTVNRSDRVLLK